MAKSVTRKAGRNASSGRWTKVKTARDNPRTHVVETIKTRKKR